MLGTPTTTIVMRLVILPPLFVLLVAGLSSSLGMSAISIAFWSVLTLLASYLLVVFSLNMVILVVFLIISLLLMQ